MTPEELRADAKIRDARKFVHDWLWKSEERATGGMPWTHEYIQDVAHMVIAFASQSNAEIKHLRAERDMLITLHDEDSEGVAKLQKVIVELRAALESTKADYARYINDVRTAEESEIERLRAELNAAGDGDTWRTACKRLEAELAERTRERDRFRNELAIERRNNAEWLGVVTAMKRERDEAREMARDIFRDAWHYAHDTSVRQRAVRLRPWLKDETETAG